ncbi:MAG TPA: response regulator [Acidobacteriaceae bacterium]|nr:response regulator [Acidobacteriaceae bacterium]
MTLPVKEPMSRPDGSRLRVLIADDEKNIAETIRIILSKEGMDAVAVYGGRAAVDKAAEWKPDILVVDYLMPDLNGLEAARRICERHAACRVLVLSALAAVHDLRHEMLRCEHPYEVLVKPIHPTDLLRLIRAVGGA